MLIPYAFCVLYFMVPAGRPNFAEINPYHVRRLLGL